MHAILPILLSLLSYLIGCFSTARIVAKTFKNLKITKVGTGHPDTANIYCNVSKTLGILVGLVDFTKMYAYLFLLQKVLLYCDSTYADHRWLMLFGFMSIIGHCLPVTRNFKGGRGIFSFHGFIAFFAFWPMIASSLLALIIVGKFKQVRFAQYMIVLLPVLFVYISNMFIGLDYVNFAYFGVSAVLMGVLNFIVSKRLGEF